MQASARFEIQNFSRSRGVPESRCSSPKSAPPPQSCPFQMSRPPLHNLSLAEETETEDTYLGLLPWQVRRGWLLLTRRPHRAQWIRFHREPKCSATIWVNRMFCFAGAGAACWWPAGCPSTGSGSRHHRSRMFPADFTRFTCPFSPQGVGRHAGGEPDAHPRAVAGGAEGALRPQGGGVLWAAVAPAGGASRQAQPGKQVEISKWNPESK